jgi:PPP family 3-phenylpropionic acid transporter
MALVVVFAQTLHLGSFGMFHLWSVSTARALFPAAAATRAQALHGAVGYGLGGAIGVFGSGLLWDGAGPRTPYLAAVFIVILAFIVAAAGTGPSPGDDSPEGHGQG